MENEHVKEICSKSGMLLAMVVQAEYDTPGINFITGPELSQQLGIIQYPKGHKVPLHTHNYSPRQVDFTQESIYVVRGKIVVDVHDDKGVFAASVILEANDCILLIKGAHAIEFLTDDVKLIENKNGPFTSAAVDKTFLSGKSDATV